MTFDQALVVLQGFIAFLVTEAVKWLGARLGVDVSGWGSLLAAGISSAAVTFLVTLAQGLPEGWGDTVRTFVVFLATLLVAGGWWGIARVVRPKAAG